MQSNAMDQMNDGKPHPPGVTAQWHKPAPVDADGQKIVDPNTLGPGTTCYTDDPADGGVEIPDCLCHKSCDTCKLAHGSHKLKPQGQDNCLTCRDGLYLNKLTTQGLARCDPQPCQMFCLQSAEVRTTPTIHMHSLRTRQAQGRCWWDVPPKKLSDLFVLKKVSQAVFPREVAGTPPHTRVAMA